MIARHETHLDKIDIWTALAAPLPADALKGADKLILATDPDREGEAISWHVLEVLRQKKALGKVQVERVVFNAITKNAVLEAIRQQRSSNG